jgi:DNA replication protein DnaC
VEDFDKYHKIWQYHGVEPRYFDKWVHNYEIESKEQNYAVQQFKVAAQCRLPIIMLGTYGGGKTHMAMALVKHDLIARRRAFYYTWQRFFREYRRTLKDPDFAEHKFFHKVETADLLVIDEINIRSGSEAENRILQDVVDKRYMANLPTIFIGNVNVEGFKEIVTERLYDRLVHQKAQVISFNWPSFRKK